MPVRLFGVLLFALLTVLPRPAVSQHDYKVSRNFIRKEKYDEALKVLAERITRFPDDSEWVYQQAIAHARAGDLDAAARSLQKARRMDVPDGRIVADAHDLLKPLAQHEPLQSVLRAHRDAIVQGPMLGDLTHHSVRVWVRTARAAEVGVQVSNEVRTVVKTSAERDFTADLRIDNLKPNTDYTYEVVIDGRRVELPFETSFRTLPAPGTPVKFSFAFGGGAGYVTKHEHMWDTIRAARPDALFLLGDNMYSDDPQSALMQRFCYRRRQSPPAFRRLVSQTPVYSIWDDHDFGTNDCSGGPAIDKPAWKIPVWNVFQQNWANPGYGGGRSQPGCWYDFTVGNVHFIMLDGRYYRDHKTKTMLGPAQKQWLKETLQESKGTFKILASPVPWDYRTKGNSKDTWNGFREERTEIFDFLAEHRIEGVVLISADRHRSDAWKIKRSNGYALYEFNSSRLTNNHVHGTKKEAIFSYNKKQSFGLVEIDTVADDPSIRYTVVTIDGEKVHSLTLRRSLLQ